MSLESETRDQILHIIGGASIVIAARLLGADIPPLAGALIGFGAGIVREITEFLDYNREQLYRERMFLTIYKPKRFLPTLWRNKVDLLFWTIGGIGGSFEI